MRKLRLSEFTSNFLAENFFIKLYMIFIILRYLQLLAFLGSGLGLLRLIIMCYFIYIWRNFEMKNLFTLLVVFAFATSINAFGQMFSSFNDKARLEVGKQPAFVYCSPTSNPIGNFVVCLGQDVNFNGTYDDGDEAPSLWKFNIISLLSMNEGKLGCDPVKIMDFRFGSISFPVRACVNADSHLLYIIEGAKAAIYNLLDNSIVKEFNIDTMASAISINGDYAYITVSPYGTAGYVKKYSLTTNTSVDSIPCGIAPRQTLPYWDGSLAILTEGNFGGTDSKISLYDVSGEKAAKFAELEVGGTANHIAMEGNYLYVTMNGSHEIKIIDLSTRTIVDSIKLPTSGYDGPRETIVRNYTNSSNYQYSEFFTTAYNGRVYYGKGLQVIDSSEVDGKRESIAPIAYSNGIAVTTINNADYSPSNILTTYEAINSVSDSPKINYANAYPCPAIDNVTINIYANQAQDATVAIYSVSGTKIAEINTLINDGKINLSAAQLNLVSGKYIANVTIGNKIYTANIIINK